MNADGTMDKKYILKIIALFCLGWAILFADRTVLYPMLQIIGKDFHLTNVQIGFIASTYFAVYTAMQIPAGVFGDKLGLKRALVVMYFIAGLGMLGVGLFANSYITLLIFVAIHGFGCGSYYPAAYGTAMTTVPQHMRGFSSAIINSGMAIGLGLGLAAAGPLYLFFNNWRAPFLALAIPTMLVALLFHTVLKDVRPKEKYKVPWSEILGNKDLMLINVAIFCSQYGFWTVLTWGPTFFMTERGLSLTVSGLYTAIVAVTAIPAAILVGRYSDRIGRKLLAIILLPLTALTIAAMGYVVSLPMLIAALVCYGIVGKFSFDPISVAWVGDHVAKTNPQAMGTAIAVFNFSGMLSSIAAPIACGYIRDTTGSLVAGFYLGATIVLIGMVVVFFVKETLEADKTPRTPHPATK